MPDAARMNPDRTLAFCQQHWDDELQARVTQFIRVPAVSPAYDREWERRGLLDHVCRDLAHWMCSLPIPGITAEVLSATGRTPLVLVEVPGSGQGSVLFYGHLDKQPGGSGWAAGSGPWEPVFDGIRLFGRGGADDGYAPYAMVSAIMAAADQGLPRPRCIGIFETSEESGSPDLRHWLDQLRDQIGAIELVICLDSGAGDFDRLWLVTSLRGHCGGQLDIRVLNDGVHSGDAGGVVPSSFRLLRQLLDRVEDSDTGRIRIDAANTHIPAERIAEAIDAGGILGRQVVERFPWHGTGSNQLANSTMPSDLLLNRSWRPSLTVVGAEGLPVVAEAGNVLQPSIRAKLSMRLPPNADSALVTAQLKETLESKPPQCATVEFHPDRTSANGWNAQPMSRWLHRTLETASRQYFNGAGLCTIGQGGTIPLMTILNQNFPGSYVLACGVQGPGAKAHGPNESLHMPYVQRLSACLGSLLAALGEGEAPLVAGPATSVIQLRFPDSG